MFIALAYKSVTLIIFLITDESCRLDKVTCISEVRITYLIKFDCVSMCMQAYVRISIEYTYVLPVHRYGFLQYSDYQ